MASLYTHTESSYEQSRIPDDWKKGLRDIFIQEGGQEQGC